MALENAQTVRIDYTSAGIDDPQLINNYNPETQTLSSITFVSGRGSSSINVNDIVNVKIENIKPGASLPYSEYLLR